jgi:hypothetical protein
VLAYFNAGNRLSADAERLNYSVAKLRFTPVPGIFMTGKSYLIGWRSNFRSRFGVTLSAALALIALTLAFGSSPDPNVPAATQFEGSFDKLAVESVGGWAWDASRPTVAIKVEIYEGGKLLGTVTAQEFRQDLKTAGKGDGNHAFNYALPQTLRDGQSHTITIKYDGTASELPGSPKTLSFPKA